MNDIIESVFSKLGNLGVRLTSVEAESQGGPDIALDEYGFMSVLPPSRYTLTLETGDKGLANLRDALKEAPVDDFEDDEYTYDDFEDDDDDLDFPGERDRGKTGETITRYKTRHR